MSKKVDDLSRHESKHDLKHEPDHTPKPDANIKATERNWNEAREKADAKPASKTEHK